MLIRFTVENYRSFGSKAEFSCLATPERGHRERIVHGPLAGLRLLSVEAIYGANASGKSNLFRAMEFARSMVTRGVKLESPIPIQPFRLDPSLRIAPARFGFEVLVNERVFSYLFSVTSQDVIEETLKEIRAASEVVLFSRKAESGGKSVWNLEYFKSLGLKADEVQFVEFLAKGTPRNQLFLTEGHARNLKYFEELWKWFRSSLILIDPQTTAMGLENQLETQGLKKYFSEMLHSADMGIEQLDTQTVTLDSLDLPKTLKSMLETDCHNDQDVVLRNVAGSRFRVRRDQGELRVSKLVTRHRVSNGLESVVFDISEESDGTQRVVDLLPAFHDLADSGKACTVFIDELDRSLHSRLTRALIEDYLGRCGKETRSQLIFTTHDTSLLDHRLFRKDEIWLVDKNEKGESELSSLSDFKLRSDKRLMKDYLLGRFGGVPNIIRLPVRSMTCEEPLEPQGQGKDK